MKLSHSVSGAENSTIYKAVVCERLHSRAYLRWVRRSGTILTNSNIGTVIE